MKATKAMTATILSGLISCALVGAASADGGSTTIGGTSNNGSNNVSITSTNSSTAIDKTTTTVTNQNSQSVSSGNVSIDDVAQVGNVSTGSAKADNTVATTVGQPGLGGGASASSGAPGGSSTTATAGGQGGSSASASAASAGKGGGSGSSVQLASVAMLPDTGASVPVDVSALRALYHNPTLGSTTIANTAGLFSGALLGGASLLSLLGAGATVLVNKRRLAIKA
jgi:hypothetical protein